MTQKKGKSRQILIRILSRFCDKRYIRHLLFLTFIALLAGAALSMLITRSITVNDTVIRYTEPPLEELDSEGYAGEDTPEGGADDGESTPEDGADEPEAGENAEGEVWPEDGLSAGDIVPEE